MVYRYNNNSLPTPFTSPARLAALRSQTVSNARLSPYGLKRSGLPPQSPSSYSDRSGSVRVKADADKENVRIRPDDTTLEQTDDYNDDSSSRLHYDPADPRTWGVKPLPPIPRSALTPARYAESTTYSKADDDASLLQSPVIPPFAEDKENSSTLADLVDEHMKIAESTCPSLNPLARVNHHRTTSSSYHSQDYESVRVQSPEPEKQVNHLSTSNLARYGKANDRISNLRSTSPFSSNPDLGSLQGQQAVDEPSLTANGWQDEPQEKQLYEGTGTESIHATPRSLRYELPRPIVCQYQIPKPDVQGASDDKGYDGANESHPHGRGYREIDASADDANGSHSPLRAIKRKASHFSLNSLSKSFSKRPRLGFRKWASSVIQQGSRRLSIAKQKLKEHAEMEKRDFAAWRAQRRRARSDAACEKEKVDAAFTKAQHENGEEWWKEEAGRFHAPRWMTFPRDEKKDQ
ncbi:hypothetical protein K4F52_006349 [Lecanicillium sp. MT-2017a]|nr:hypothetical protein K4F52_006349 [Lecanicillium sp. MT-2017a]